MQTGTQPWLKLQLSKAFLGERVHIIPVEPLSVDPIVLRTDLTGTPTRYEHEPMPVFKKVSGFKSDKAVMSEITVVNRQRPYPWRHSWST